MTITGFHSIEEKIRSLFKNKDAAPSYKLFYSKPGPRVKKILEAAKEAGVTAEQVDAIRSPVNPSGYKTAP